MLFLLWIFRIYDSKGAILFRTSLDIPLLGFFVWAGLSLLWTADFHESLNSVIALGKQIFLFYLAATTVKTMDQFVKILCAFLVAMFIIDIYAVTDFFTRGGSLLNRSVRAGSFASLDYNLLTCLIVIFLPLGFIFGITVDSKKIKNALTLFSLISLLALFLGYTRAGWITIAIQLLIFGWLYSRRIFNLILGGLFGLLLILLLALPLVQQYNAQIVETQKKLFADTLDLRNFELRVEVWKFGFSQIKNHPLLGHGFGKEIFSKLYYDTEIIKNTSHMHNTLIETLFEIGIPGLLLLILCFWKILSRSYDLYKTSDDSFINLYAIFMITMVSGFLFKNFFDHMFVGNIAEIFWILAGLLFLRSLKENTPHFH